jgi:hypothetical protein
MESKKIIIGILIMGVLLVLIGCNYGPVESEQLENKVNADFDSLVESKNEEEHDHEHSVEIEGSAMKSLTVKEVADLWSIDSEELLNAIIEEFDFKGSYTELTVLEEMRAEYKFSPAIIKDLAEDIKTNKNI